LNTVAIGVDPGSYKTVLACISTNTVEIVLSETANRFTPSLVAFTQAERLIGDSAQNQMRKNFKNTL
jgi:molecular chaperone DnaK (HSP70)